MAVLTIKESDNWVDLADEMGIVLTAGTVYNIGTDDIVRVMASGVKPIPDDGFIVVKPNNNFSYTHLDGQKLWVKSVTNQANVVIL